MMTRSPVAPDDGSHAATPLGEDEVLLRAVRRVRSLLLGLVFGILLGGGIFLVTALLLLKGGAHVGPHLSLLGQFFPGYTVTWGGSVLGFFYGFATGFGIGWLIGWVYNSVLRFRRSHA